MNGGDDWTGPIRFRDDPAPSPVDGPDEIEASDEVEGRSAGTHAGTDLDLDAERTVDAATAGAGGSADAERTTDADADLVEHVRALAREARAGLAAPPVPPDTDPAPTSETVAADPPVRPEPARGFAPPAPEPAVADAPFDASYGARPGELPPPTPATTAAATAATARVASTGSTRWQPPPRLRPADVPSAAPLLAERPQSRRHVDWRWVLAAVVIAAGIGFLAARAGGGDSDDPPPATDVSGSTVVTTAPSGDGTTTVTQP